MGLSKEAEAEKPKRPLNAYMRFRADRFKELGTTSNKSAIVIEEWKNLSQAQRDALNKKVKDEVDAFDKKLQAWRKKFNVSAEEEKKKKSKKKEEEEETKPQKSRGNRKKKNEESDSDSEVKIKSKGGKAEKAEKEKELSKEKKAKNKSKSKGKQKKTR